jgi:bidirectional [NiFe] hydrogenase diaphorase subunit
MTLEELEEIGRRERTVEQGFQHRVNVCVAAGCLSCQSDAVKEALSKAAAARNGGKFCRIKGVGCMGLCSEGPLVSTGAGQLYRRGRDTAFAVPPAQIRTGGFPASGSCLRW